MLKLRLSNNYMPETVTKEADDIPTFEAMIQTGNIALDRNTFVACGNCRRMNPPNRFACIYCGEKLEIENAVLAKPKFRQMEVWERGVNVVFVSKAADVSIDIAKVAHLLSSGVHENASVFETSLPLPIARVENEAEARRLSDDLLKLGVICRLITDLSLNSDNLPVRLGRADLIGDRFVLKAFNTGRLTEIPTTDLALIIPGIIRTGRVESLEKRGVRGRVKSVDNYAGTSDELVLDLYTSDDPTGFRINLSGFDFSCLAENKGLLAAENLGRLIDLIKIHAVNARKIPDYAAIRSTLDEIWPIDICKESEGLKQSGFGKREYGRVLSTSNLSQFTKYSRLQWHLL